MKNSKPKVRVPRQERSIEKKQLIIDAAIKLFSDTGYENVGPKQIADEAGVSVGTLYSYFGDKSDLLVEIIRTSKKGRVDAILNRAKEISEYDSNPRSVIYMMIKGIMNAPALPPLLLRQSIAMRYTHKEVEAFHRQEEKQTLALIHRLFGILGDAVKVKDRKLAEKMLLLTLKESTRTYTIFRPSIPKERFINELTDMISRYLFTE